MSLGIYPLSLFDEAGILKTKKLSLYDAFVRKPVNFGHCFGSFLFSTQSEVHLLNHPWHSNYHVCHC